MTKKRSDEVMASPALPDETVLHEGRDEPAQGDRTVDPTVQEALAPTPAQPEPAMRPAAAPPARRGGWAGPVIGGVIAAGLGFGLAQYLPLTGAGAGATSGVSSEDLAALQAEVTDLRAALAATPGADLDGLTARLAALEAQAADPEFPDLAALEGRIAALEARPVGSLSGADAAALAGLQAEVASLKQGGIPQAQVDAANAELQARLDEAMAAAQALQADAADTATRSAERAALLQISAALDTGAPYGSALKVFGGAALPAVLVDNAAGLPSLKTLQDSFPEAARLALDAALKDRMGDSWTERVTAYLRTQVGARSLTPREGDDPDAVLSRAEAHLAAGDVGAALVELDSLPEVAKSALASWRLGADLRQSAVAALGGLMQERGL